MAGIVQGLYMENVISSLSPYDGDTIIGFSFQMDS